MRRVRDAGPGPKAGKRDEVVALMSEPPTGAANGYRGSYVLKADEGTSWWP